jgi:hypothetical protein
VVLPDQVFLDKVLRVELVFTPAVRRNQQVVVAAQVQ